MNITRVQIPNTNYDSNRTPIDTVVIHWIVGNLAAADAVFTKVNSVSAHYGVEDNEVHQYVDEDKVAYHAGVYSVNQRSIGIEHSASPQRAASEQTYQTSGELLAQICKRWNIPLDRGHIKGHKEFKATQCPGTMDIDKLIRIAKENSQGCEEEKAKLREEADTNWNGWTALSNEAGIEATPEDKVRMKEKGVQAIKDLKQNLQTCENRPPETVEVIKEVIKEVPVEVIKEVERVKEVPEEKIRKMSFFQKLSILFS